MLRMIGATTRPAPGRQPEDTAALHMGLLLDAIRPEAATTLPRCVALKR